MMKTKEIKEKTVVELKKMIQEKRLELSQVRFDIRAKQIKNHQQGKLLRKEIARLLTELRAKEKVSKIS